MPDCSFMQSGFQSKAICGPCKFPCGLLSIYCYESGNGVLKIINNILKKIKNNGLVYIINYQKYINNISIKRQQQSAIYKKRIKK